MRVASDIGGTFTDLVSLDERTGRLGSAKADTTPAEFERGVIDTLRKAGVDVQAINFFVHGTTVIINALTERKGVRTGLITTRGFRDVLEIGRANRPDLYNLTYAKPRPFVPRALRLEVTERVNYKGEVLVPLAEDEVLAAAAGLIGEQVEAIGICFLHAYANPAHEARAAQLIRQRWPQIAVTASHEITREWREYERTSTTVLNSYVKPIAARYLDRLDRELARIGVGGARYVMQSSGGTATFAAAREAPIAMVESGPVAGVLGAAAIGRVVREANLISLDIGGTTAKTSLVERGDVKVTTDYKIEWTRVSAGYPIKIPVVDIVEIGGGGGAMHATALADELRIARVLIPTNPAVFSAWGMLMTDLRYDLIWTSILRTQAAANDGLDRMWRTLEDQARTYFAQQRVEPSRLVFQRFADMRYAGQEHTVKVPVPAGAMTAAAIGEVEGRFHALHEQRYTFRLPSAVEFVNFHLTAFGTVDKPRVPRLRTAKSGAGSGGKGAGRSALKGRREVDFDAHGRLASAVYERDRLRPGAAVSGPAIIEEPAATTVLFPGQRATVDAYGNLMIESERAR